MPGKKEKKAAAGKTPFDFVSFLQHRESVAGLAADEESLTLLADAVAAEQSENVLPAGTVRQNGVGDSDALRQALRDLKRAAPAARSVVLSLPPEHVWMNVIEFPGYLSKSALEEAIRLHLEFALPFPKEEAYVDWEIIDGGEEIFVRRLVLGAARKSLVDPFTDLLDGAGFSAVAVESHISSIERAIRGEAADKVLYAVVYPSGVHFGAYDGASFRFQRFVPWDKLIAAGTNAKPSPHQVLVKEAEKIMRFLRAEKHGAMEIKRVAAVCSPEFFSSLAPLAKGKIPLRAVNAGAEAWNRAALAARGAGIRGTLARREDTLMSFNALGTEAIYEWTRASSFSAFFAKLAVGIGACFLVFHGALYFFLSDIARKAAAREVLRVEESQDVVRLQDEKRKFNLEVAELDALSKRNPEWGTAIGIAGKLANPGITLTGVFIENPAAGMSIAGVAKNRDALLQLKAAAAALGAFKDVEIPFTFLIAKGEVPFRFDLRFVDDKVLRKKK
ncbi:pilus assembly protein PilM [Candidatus Uhrbacteria bacterium]|nr:pilus assembly protein PilM [Candidatus Uhrbacteria bacterium]